MEELKSKLKSSKLDNVQIVKSQRNGSIEILEPQYFLKLSQFIGEITRKRVTGASKAEFEVKRGEITNQVLELLDMDF